MTEGNGHFTLLLVDDNPTNLSLLAQIVEMDLSQVRVLTARSAEEGLELTAEHEVDGAFVDVQMPGMSGLDLCRKLKDDPHCSHIPVVLMTAHIATAELRAEGLDAGAYDFISQPISNVEMLARIKVMLRLRQSEKRLLSTNEQLRNQVASKTSALRWLSGLLLAGGDDVAEEDRELAAKLEARLPQDRLLSIEHFTGQLFQEMPLRWRRTVLKLTLLDEIPLALAERLAEITDIKGALDYLWRHNFFVDHDREGTGCYHFQQELRDRLRRQAAVDLSAQEWEEVRLLAAEWYRQHGQVLTALNYLLVAELYSEAELLLSQHGIMLIDGERLPRLTELMESVPEAVAVKRGWMALFSGIGKHQRQPKEAETWLELARTHFVSKTEGRGELLTLVQQVVQYLVDDGRFGLGRESLPRIEELLEQYKDELDPISCATGYSALSIGEAFFGGNLEQADRYAREGLKLVARLESAELQFILRQMCAYVALLRGRFLLMFAELEISQTLSHQHPLTETARFFQQVLICDLLLCSGDFFNCREQYLHLEQSLGRGFLQQSPMGPVLCRNQIECLLAEGKWEEARDRVEICVSDGPAVFNPHLRSMLLQYRALLWVGNAERENSALLDLQESIRLREETGGLRHTLNNWIISAVCYTEQGEYSRAEQLLQQALELSLSQGEMLVRSSIYARQADLLLRQGREQNALLPLRQLLEMLERKQQEHFFLLTPDLLQRLLPLAVLHQVLPVVARKLAVRHLRSQIRDDGSLLPLLEVVTLAPSGIFQQGNLVLACSELGSVARQMVDYLVVAPNHKLGLDLLLGMLWPESSPTKARASFDTNLSRLRKMLDGALFSGASREYLVLEKGVLSLQNTISDCQMFADAVRKGQQHVRRQELWQAGLAFRCADHLWQGEFLAGQDLPDELIAERQRLTELRLEMVEGWSELLMADDTGEEIEPLLQEGVRLDPTREQLVQKFYRYYLRRHDPVQARKVLDNYRQALLRDDYSTEDAEDIVQALERNETSAG